jgi:hypothetical protein
VTGLLAATGLPKGYATSSRFLITLARGGAIRLDASHAMGDDITEPCAVFDGLDFKHHHGNL